MTAISLASDHGANQPDDAEHPEHQSRTAVSVLIDTLQAWGVRHVLTCPGSTEAAFLVDAAERLDLAIILTLHESVAVAMADGIARETHRPAVAYLHANVGLTNGLAHLSAAQLAYSPVVVLTGLKQTAIQNRGGFTTAPYVRDFVRQYTKSAWQCLRADALGEDVNRALRVAATAPQGPTWLGVPQDVAEAQTWFGAPPSTGYRVTGRRRAGADETEAAVALLQAAGRVVVVAGAHVVPDGLRALLELAERTGGVLLSEDRRTAERTVVPADHLAYAGAYSVDRDCVRQADLLVFAGGRCVMEFEAPTFPQVPERCSVIHLHPDPGEVAKIYRVDVALVGDAPDILHDLLARLDELGATPGTDEAPFRAEARREHRLLRDRALAPRPAANGRLDAPTVVTELVEALDANTTVVGDATTAGGLLLHAVELVPGLALHTTSSGSLGWGAGFALGVKLADPGRRVVAVLGDGVFQFGLPALWTAVRYAIPVTFVILNNESYAAVGAAIRRYQGHLAEPERRVAVDLGGPHLAEIARGYGVHAVRIRRHGQLGKQLVEAADRDGPTVIEVMTDPTDLGP